MFTGSCGSGCSTGLHHAPDHRHQQRGHSRAKAAFLIDTNPSKVVLTTGQIIGGNPNATAAATGHVCTGTSFPVSVLLETAQTIPTQSNNIAPGTVTVPIVTSGEPAGFAGSTAALARRPPAWPASSDQQVVDGRPHKL